MWLLPPEADDAGRIAMGMQIEEKGLVKSTGLGRDR
jgi:hypothetical protein